MCIGIRGFGGPCLDLGRRRAGGLRGKRYGRGIPAKQLSQFHATGAGMGRRARGYPRASVGARGEAED